ncbi:MAG: type II secretion system F family protein [Lachnospiraceae bacterium]|nr:type II secretion system F family protein [Lachnospiraceae bacterium]
MNYHVYKLNLLEYLLYGFFYLLADALISYLFFMSVIAFIIFLPGIVFYYRFLSIILKKRRDTLLTFQFKEFITIISSLLSTGYSLDNAIVESCKELKSLYPNSLILDEALKMSHKIMLHIPTDTLFTDFANRTDIEHIKTFSEILTISTKSGGNLIQIIMSTTASISSQIEIHREIDTSLAGKKYELYIMAIMPLIIILYIRFTQPGFFNPVYNTLLGSLLMFICLAFYMLAIYIAYKILARIH